ncbi:MAG: hypothetical protein HUU20_09005 [Pirellulales bacterium]|nr:hypothetical protein [Pirellulales bacterium]
MTRRFSVAVSLITFLAAALSCVQPAVSQQDGQAAPKSSRKWVLYLLPHSHVDIGYTHVQTEVARIHRQVIETALDLCRKTADYPPEARFKWNVEVLWAVDSYLRESPPEKQQQLVDAVRAGQFGLDAFYGNELTGLCRPEELLRMMQWGASIGRRCGVKVDSAMTSDVPGFTWGLVSAMAQAGVKYFSMGPNLDHRVGRTVTAWEDKPFYWVAPDGQHKVLCWTAHAGYAGWSLYGAGSKLAERLSECLARLEKKGYPYDLVQLRWSLGDNQGLDASLPDVVKEWNATHEYPRLVIATTAEMFREFERRYADKIPVVRGDFTPYWEDGAASSARETALNRMAGERLVQAETLWALLNPKEYPARRFMEAWRNVLLYDEHTWGARQYNVTDYDVPFITDQWKIKQAFALDGDAQSRSLLDAVFPVGGSVETSDAVDVFNTSSWARTDLVVLPGKARGDVVTGPHGEAIPSQRLSTGELAFLAKDVPPLAGRRYMIGLGKADAKGEAKAQAASLATPFISVQLDPGSGTIASLRSAGIDAELSDMKSGMGLNRYCYVVRDRLEEPLHESRVKIAVQESGPLVASLRVESDAPGCANLTRDIRVVDGLDRVDIVNVLDKKEVREKEGVHLGFAFNVPDGVMRIDIPWAVFRPEVDQIPGACKEWLSVGRWVDVSNRNYGITWATLDAPIIEVGSLAAKLGKSEAPESWRSRIGPSQTLYSYVMNNYWITNYRAFQSGPTTFRYGLLPHKQYDLAAAQRFGIECSQPLVVTRAVGAAPSGRPFFELDTPDVIVASIKPSEDRKALIVRVFGAAGRPANATLRWAEISPRTIWLSNLAEEPVAAVEGAVHVPAFGLVTLRVE